MKKSVMKKWVAALRSGEFKQVQMSLNRDGKHCCLGVLCDLALVDGYVECDFSGPTYITLYGERNRRGVLPEEVMKYSGIGDSIGVIRKLDTDLASLNDSGKSFSEIADIIEKHYKEL